MTKENRQYLLVGLFVIVTTSVLVGVWLWFLSNDRQSYNTFLAVFTEPTDGITTNSIVKYNGVEVGKVKAINLDTSNQHHILVYLNVLQNIPINADTYATLKPLGLTGLSFINMHLPKNSSTTKNLTPHNKPPYPQIKTEPSFLYNLSEQAQSVTSNVNDVSLQLKILLNNKNLDHVASVLNNMDKVTTEVAKHSNDITKSMDYITQILADIKRNTKGITHTINNIDELTNTLIKTTNNANTVITGIQQNTLRNFNAVILPNLNQTIEHMDQSSYQLEQLLILLNQNPSALIRGITKPKQGPSEKMEEEK
jgi:phospholipid/cholesterol/gamma-HCH transport system substrate-binding protein